MGVHGEKSSLFWEIVRVIDLHPCVKAVFLENTPGFATPELGFYMCLSAFAQRGFKLSWCNTSAGEVGAPICRRRFYCLAVRDDSILDHFREFYYNKPLQPAYLPWKRKETVPRVVMRRTVSPCKSQEDRSLLVRCRMLGN